MVHIKYKIWFALKLEIEDFGGNAFDVCDLVPTDRCQQNLDRGRILVKRQPSLLTHLIEVAADGPTEDLPVYAPLDAAAFKYKLINKGTRLLALTNLESLDLANHQVYMSNEANNKIGSVLHLNKTGDKVSADDRVLRGRFDEGAEALAIINIFQTNLVPADYRLRDGAGKCREPVFTVRLAKHA